MHVLQGSCKSEFLHYLGQIYEQAAIFLCWCIAAPITPPVAKWKWYLCAWKLLSLWIT